MFKLTTQLAYFRFNSSVSHGTLNVTWFALDIDAEEGRCFTQTELDAFTNFVINRPHNFPGGKNYHTCNNDDAPYCGAEMFITGDNSNYPTTYILRKNPELLSGEQPDVVDIILTDINDTDKHNYDLPFDVIGKVDL